MRQFYNLTMKQWDNGAISQFDNLKMKNYIYQFLNMQASP